MMPKQEAAQEYVQDNKFSLDNLRSIVSSSKTTGRLSNQARDYINNAINSFSLTQECSQIITKLLGQSQNFGADRTSLKQSFEEGLFTTLNLTERLIGSLSKTNIQTMINEFVTHCSQTTESFIRMQCGQNNKGVFNSIISHPHFYEPQVLEKLSAQITDTSYFSTSVLKLLITRGVRIQAMSEESKRFDELVKENNISKSYIGKLRIQFLKGTERPKKRQNPEAVPQKQTTARRNLNESFGKINTPSLALKINQPTSETPYVDCLTGERKKIFEQFSQSRHPFLTLNNLKYYFGRYNQPKEFIHQGVKLYNSIRPEYKNDFTFGILPVVEEAILILKSEAKKGINIYLNIITSERAEKYEKIPENTFRLVIRSFFIKEKDLNPDKLVENLDQAQQQN
jgi:hypothetical protein